MADPILPGMPEPPEPDPMSGKDPETVMLYRQAQILLEAVEYVADGECVNGGRGCDPESLDGLCEVCTCRDAKYRAKALQVGV